MTDFGLIVYCMLVLNVSDFVWRNELRCRLHLNKLHSNKHSVHVLSLTGMRFCSILHMYSEYRSFVRFGVDSIQNRSVRLWHVRHFFSIIRNYSRWTRAWFVDWNYFFLFRCVWRYRIDGCENTMWPKWHLNESFFSSAKLYNEGKNQKHIFSYILNIDQRISTAHDKVQPV